MKGLLKYLFIVTAALSMSSCASKMQEKVSIDGYENLQLMGYSGAKVDLLFSNESAHKIKVQDVTVLLKDSGKSIATLTMKEEIEIPRRCEEYAVPTVWKFSDVNFLAAIPAAKKILSNGNMSSLRVDVKATAKVSIVKKKIERKNLLLSDLIGR